MQCPRCPSSLSVLDLTEHIQRIHLRKAPGLLGCGDCHFDSDSLNDAITHCLTEDHDPRTLRFIRPMELIDLAMKVKHTSPRFASSQFIQPMESSRFDAHGYAIDYSRYDMAPSPRGQYGNDITSPKSSRKRKKNWSSLNVLEKPSLTLPENKYMTTSVTPNRDSTKDKATNVLPRIHSNEGIAVSKNEIPSVDANLQTFGDTERSEEEFISDGAMTCLRCNKSVRVGQQNGTINLFNVASHVTTCLQMKPYSCEACDYSSGRKFQMKAHISNKHAGAEDSIKIMLTEKFELIQRQPYNPRLLRNESAVRQGISDCFPSVNSSSWNGI